eukprot:TRINITY_DN4202_c0_g1_i1.p1 TRINITY_DN4202_c0_g1~~TRINITY_DN4202_c0_g1_i1.p1  ORF type:complete len:955 (-),score=134.09 TRINITY_DN4202_c0_g1_i1:178-2994(-)
MEPTRSFAEAAEGSKLSFDPSSFADASTAPENRDDGEYFDDDDDDAASQSESDSEEFEEEPAESTAGHFTGAHLALAVDIITFLGKSDEKSPAALLSSIQQILQRHQNTTPQQVANLTWVTNTLNSKQISVADIRSLLSSTVLHCYDVSATACKSTWCEHAPSIDKITNVEKEPPGYFECLSPPLQGISLNFQNSGLREPQVEAVSQAYHFYENPCDKCPKLPTNTRIVGLVQMPTGLGKSILMALLPFILSKGRVLFLGPPRKVVSEMLWRILRQMSTVRDPKDDTATPMTLVDFKRWKSRRLSVKLPSAEASEQDFIQAHRKIGAEKHAQTGSKDLNTTRRDIFTKIHGALFIMNVDQVRQVEKDIKNKKIDPKVVEAFFDYIIVDEVHHITESKYETAISLFPKAQVIGFSATPWGAAPSDQLHMQPIYRCSLKHGVDAGALRAPKLHLCEFRGGDAADLPVRLNANPFFRYTGKASFVDWPDSTWTHVLLSDAFIRGMAAAVVRQLIQLRSATNTTKDLGALCTAFGINHALRITRAIEDAAQALQQKFVVVCNFSRGNKKRLAKLDLEKNGFNNDDVVRWRKAFDDPKAAYDVLVHVNTVSEGFDRPGLSICAFFTPILQCMRFAQIVGRTTRKRSATSDNLPDIAYCTVMIPSFIKNLIDHWNMFFLYDTYGATISGVCDTDERDSIQFSDASVADKHADLWSSVASNLAPAAAAAYGGETETEVIQLAEDAKLFQPTDMKSNPPENVDQSEFEKSKKRRELVVNPAKEIEDGNWKAGAYVYVRHESLTPALDINTRDARYLGRLCDLSEVQEGSRGAKCIWYGGELLFITTFAKRVVTAVFADLGQPCPVLKNRRGAETVFFVDGDQSLLNASSVAPKKRAAPSPNESRPKRRKFAEHEDAALHSDEPAGPGSEKARGPSHEHGSPLWDLF